MSAFNDYFFLLLPYSLKASRVCVCVCLIIMYVAIADVTAVKGGFVYILVPFESFRKTVNRLEVYNWFGKDFQRNKQILALGDLSLLVVG